MRFSFTSTLRGSRRGQRNKGLTQRAVGAVRTQVAEAEATEKDIDESRERYRPVAYRGAIMYFCVRDFNVVDPMYQYSLQWFTNLFVQASCIQSL